jgi:hypothetical protein
MTDLLIELQTRLADALRQQRLDRLRTWMAEHTEALASNPATSGLAADIWLVLDEQEACELTTAAAMEELRSLAERPITIWMIDPPAHEWKTGSANETTRPLEHRFLLIVPAAPSVGPAGVGTSPAVAYA